MDIKNIYMVKFSYRTKDEVIDYEFQSSQENYIRLDGEKKRRLRFIGLEKEIYDKFINELLNLGIQKWNYTVDIYNIEDDSWSLLLCGTNTFSFTESDILEEDYENVFRIIKKYDLD